MFLLIERNIISVKKKNLFKKIIIKEKVIINFILYGLIVSIADYSTNFHIIL